MRVKLTNGTYTRIPRKLKKKRFGKRDYKTEKQKLFLHYCRGVFSKTYRKKFENTSQYLWGLRRMISDAEPHEFKSSTSPITLKQLESMVIAALAPVDSLD